MQLLRLLAMILTMAQQLLQMFLFFAIIAAAVVQLFNNLFTRGAALREPLARVCVTNFDLGGYLFSMFSCAVVYLNDDNRTKSRNVIFFSCITQS